MDKLISKIESKQRGYITGELAINIIKELAFSQGCWGRMLRDLIESDSIDDFKNWIEEQKFTDEIEMIMRLEGN